MNIKDMTPEQVSELVHTRVMRKPIEPCTGENIEWDWDNKAYCRDCSAYARSSDPNDLEHTIKRLPRYAESMDDAWLVVEKMLARQEGEYYFNHFEWRGPLFKPSYQYLTSEGYPLGTTCWYVYLCAHGHGQFVCAETPLMAICKAALMAAGAIDKDGNVNDDEGVQE